MDGQLVGSGDAYTSDRSADGSAPAQIYTYNGYSGDTSYHTFRVQNVYDPRIGAYPFLTLDYVAIVP